MTKVSANLDWSVMDKSWVCFWWDEVDFVYVSTAPIYCNICTLCPPHSMDTFPMTSEYTSFLFVDHIDELSF